MFFKPITYNQPNRQKLPFLNMPQMFFNMPTPKQPVLPVGRPRLVQTCQVPQYYYNQGTNFCQYAVQHIQALHHFSNPSVPPKPLPYLQYGDTTKNALIKLSKLLNQAATQPSLKTTPEDPQALPLQPIAKEPFPIQATPVPMAKPVPVLPHIRPIIPTALPKGQHYAPQRVHYNPLPRVQASPMFFQSNNLQSTKSSQITLSRFDPDVFQHAYTQTARLTS